jgi:hypothetical protein
VLVSHSVLRGEGTRSTLVENHCSRGTQILYFYIGDHRRKRLGTPELGNNSCDFVFLQAIRVILDVFRASSLMLFEGAVVAIIKEHGGDYGLQKLFGTLGAVVFGPLSGQLIDMEQKKSSSRSNPAGAYMSVILLYFALRTVTAVCLLKVSLGFKPPAKKVVKNVWQVMRNTEVLAFLVAFLISGILWGFLENFLFWLLEDLGSTKFLMGMSLAVGTLAGLPLTVFSGDQLVRGKEIPS